MIEATTRPDPYARISDGDHTAFRRNGHLLVRGALDRPLRARITAAADELRAAAEPAADGSVRVSGVFRHPAFAELLDPPAVFPHIWGHLGWNIVVDHSELTVIPPASGPAPARAWEQDGPPHDDDPRPMLAIKVGYALSDLSEPGRGAPMIIPGSQHSDAPPQPPEGAVEVTAAAGDAVILDRRLWRSATANRSALTTTMVFVGYTYRWLRAHDEALPYATELSPLHRQLLGLDADQGGFFGITGAPAPEDNIPLRAELKKRGLLDGGRHYLG